MEHLKPPQALRLSEEKDKSECWRQWKRSWDLYKVASGLEEKSQKIQVATLLHVLGKECQEIFSQFRWDDEGDSEKISTVEDKFQAYFEPLCSKNFNRHLFIERNQKDGESVDEYCGALKALAKNCDLGDKEESWITTKLVLGLRDIKLKERLMETDKSLEDTLKSARIVETSRQHLQSITSNGAKSTDTVEAVDLVGQRNPKTQRNKASNQKNKERKSIGKPCSKCGTEHIPMRCPAYGKQCHKCKQVNHFAKMCQKKIRDSKKPVDSVVEHEGQDKDLEENQDVESEEVCVDEFESFFIGSLEAGQKDWTETVNFGNLQVKFKLDSGAQCNVLPKSLYDKISSESLDSTTVKLESYSKTFIRPIGQCSLTGENRGKKHRLCFQVVNGDYTPLLGRVTCEEMGLIQRVNYVNIETLMKDYADVYSGLGCLPGEYHITVDPDIPPVVHPPRRIPHAKRSKLKQELDRMVRSGIIEKVPINEPADWVNSTVVVDKPNGSVRVCLDPRDLNVAIKREHYPLPTVEEITARCAGAKLFTTLDAENAFYQIKLDKESQKLLTFNTPFGRFRYLRMPMGIKSAPEVYQQRMELVFEGLDGVEVMMDDILVHGQDEKEHDARLQAALQRARQNNLKLNQKKSKVKQTEVKYLGHIFTGDGLKTDPEKVRAVMEMPRPTDKTGVQRLLGVLNYVSKFIPNMSDLTAPLRQLLIKETAWHWDQKQEESFQAIKRILSAAPVLAYYNPTEKLTLQVDASSTGLGAVLIQDDRPVAYASKALTPAQQSYSQLEKELLAVVFGCSKFDEYIVGRDVKVETDHKPLESITKKPLYAAPLRLQRMLVQLQRYPTIKLTYKRGEEMYFADTLSRAYLKETLVNTEVLEISVLDHMISDTQIDRFAVATAKDITLSLLQSVVMAGWPETKEQTPNKIQDYWNIRDEITISQGLLLKGEKIIVPEELRNEIVEKLHSGHLGINKTLQRAREVLYWPGMNQDIKESIQQCPNCLENQPSQRAEPLQSHEIPPLPWSKVGTDLLQKDGRNYIVIVDYYSKWPELTRLNSCTSAAVINALKSQFARYGIPTVLISDNGPCYSSKEFKDFTAEWDIQHITSSPGFPKSNGQAERTVRTVKAMLEKAKDPYTALLAYRNTPIDGVNLSPAQMLMGRRLRTTVPQTPKMLIPQRYDPQEVIGKLKERQERQKSYHDKSTRPLMPLKEGETVRIQEDKKWKPAQVVKQLQEPRSYLVQTEKGTYRRNRRHLLKTEEPKPPEMDDLFEEQETATSGMTTRSMQSKQEPQKAEQPEVPSTGVTTRSGRLVKPPKKFEDFIRH